MAKRIWEDFANVHVAGEMRYGKNSSIKVDNTDGTTSSIALAELAALDGIAAADLAKIDGITNGTAAAGKAVVLDASKGISTITSATITTLTSTTVNATNVDAGASGTAGTVDVFPTTASKGKVAITAADSAGDTTTTIVNASQAGARTYTIPDAGASASFLMTEGAQTKNANFTLATGADLIFSGTTGQNELHVADNLADALSVKIAGGNDFFVLDSTDSAEKMDVVTRLTTTDGVASGTARVVGGRAYTNTAASTAVTNTTTETLFDTKYSIPANTLKAGTLIRVRFQGIATATNATDTLAIALKIGSTDAAPPVGGTTLISIPATDVTNNDVFTGEYDLICRTVGAGGTMVGIGTFKSIPAAEGTMTIKDDILASTTVDTTAAQLLAVSATWSVANAGNSCRLDFLSVEIL